MGSGFFSELFTHVGQSGTHVDPPAHFVKGLHTVDQRGTRVFASENAVGDVPGSASASLARLGAVAETFSVPNCKYAGSFVSTLGTALRIR
jgi:kynurenine formamidase